MRRKNISLVARGRKLKEEESFKHFQLINKMPTGLQIQRPYV